MPSSIEIMDERKLIRWGIIGCGDVTEIKSGPAFQKVSGSALVAVMRRRGDLAADYARRHNVPRWYDDADALIADPDVDAVYVATPPVNHLEAALKVAAAGKPGYVEKPMSRNHAECVAMVEAFAAAKQPLFVAYYRRALPRFVKAKELIDTGRLGTITGVTYRQSQPGHRSYDPNNLPWRLQAEHAGAGLFLDLASHTLDVFDYLLGPLQHVVGEAKNVASPYDVEDSVAMQFSTPGGALGVGTWNYASSRYEDLIEISGTDARISMSTFGNDPVRLIGPDAEVQFDLPNPPHVHQPLVQTMVDDLLGRGKCPSTGVSAARTSAVMDTVLAGYYGGRDDAFWERPTTWPGRRG